MRKPGSLARSRLRRRMEGGIQTTWIASEGGGGEMYAMGTCGEASGRFGGGKYLSSGGGHWRHRTRAQGGGRC